VSLPDLPDKGDVSGRRIAYRCANVRRLGHSSPAFTMATYVHEFGNGDEAAAQAIDAVFKVEKP
jgi:hypothetical protein